MPPLSSPWSVWVGWRASSAGRPQRTQDGGVVPGLGGEVSGESQGVGVFGQPQARALGPPVKSTRAYGRAPPPVAGPAHSGPEPPDRGLRAALRAVLGWAGGPAAGDGHPRAAPTGRPFMTVR